MKHIKRKYKQHLDDIEIENRFKTGETIIIERGRDGYKKLLNTKGLENKIITIHTTKDYYINAFVAKDKGHLYVFPEPDPTLIFFSSSQYFKRLVEVKKAKLLPKVNIQKLSPFEIETELIHEIFDYYSAVSGFIIFLYTSFESFNNSLFKPGFTYLSKKGERMDNYIVQSSLDLDEKIKKAIPLATGKDFYKDYGDKNRFIGNLELFRNDIIHTKSNNSHIQHDSLIKKSLTFNYNGTLEFIAKYMNFYKPNYIFECDCGKNH